MSRLNFEALTSQQLSHLLRIEDMQAWGQRDSAGALRHQLGAPMLPTLAAIVIDNTIIPRLEQLMAQHNMPADQTFQEHLSAATPILDVLHEIKRMARRIRDESASPLQGAPATVLYYGSLAAALVGCRVRISQLSDTELVTGFRWALVQPGAETLGGLFGQALAYLTTPRLEQLLQ